jgi:signal transduction histidine kinase
MTLLGKDDEKIKCLVSGSIVSWNGEQQFLASISPIGDSEKVEMEIRATEERYERLLVAQLENQQAEIARELHDSLGSRLAGVSMLLGGFQQKHPEIGTEITMAVEQIQTAAEVSRRLSRGLMPVEASQGAFWRALERLCADYVQIAGVQCKFVMECDCETIDGVTGNHLYRIAQEAMVNAVRHGQASVLEVRLEEQNDRIVMSVIDNGRQMATKQPAVHSSSGIGLKSMQARAKSIGAAFRWYANDLGGITVAIFLEPPP